MKRYPAWVLIPVALISLILSVAIWKWRMISDTFTYTDFSVPFSGTFSLKTTDRTRGATDAQFVVVEYGDLDCPYCRQFHPVMQKFVGECTDVKWVFKHFPLTSHPYSYQKALLTECAVRSAGNDTPFWPVVDRWYATDGLPDFGNLEFYTKMLAGTTADPAQTMACVKGSLAADRIDDERDEGKTYGFSRTPSLILVNTKTGAKRTIVGTVSAGELRRSLRMIGRP